MTRRFSHLKASLMLSAGSLLLAAFSTLMGQRVSYLDYLPLFNALAAVMLALSVAALLAGAMGTWQTRGRRASLWIADTVANSVIRFYVFNP